MNNIPILLSLFPNKFFAPLFSPSQKLEMHLEKVHLLCCFDILPTNIEHYFAFFCSFQASFGKKCPMDKIDRKILAELQSDGRLSVTELADRVGLSVSPCHRRVRALEESGAIVGYYARLSPEELGLRFSAIVFVTLREGDRVAVNAFEEAVLDIPQVILAQRLFGDPDYMLHVITWDLCTFQNLYDEKLSALPGVQRLTSTLVMKNIIQNRTLPL